MEKNIKKRLITEERRSHLRAEKTLKVEVCSTRYLLISNSLSSDISEDGICLLSSRKIEIGELVRLDIHFPGIEEPSTILGEVVRRNDTNDIKFPFIIGIKFTVVPPDTLEEIKKHVRFYTIIN